jgi:hypothetical protein
MRTLSILFLTLCFTSAVAQQGKIQGTWLNNSFGYQMALVLRADGTGEFDGEAIRYTTKENKFSMFIVADGQTLVYNYTLQGNSLTMSGGDLDETVVFARSDASTGAPVQAPQPSAAPTSGGGKRVAQELVGKWCYVNVNSTNSGGSSTEQCITLKADGTYEYDGETSRSVNTNAYAGGTNTQSSDRGTWTYDGTRVYYTSSAGAGSGSYVLEKRNHPKNNDPMIVLDGTTYVTYYQKAPWR